MFVSYRLAVAFAITIGMCLFRRIPWQRHGQTQPTKTEDTDKGRRQLQKKKTRYRQDKKKKRAKAKRKDRRQRQETLTFSVTIFPFCPNPLGTALSFAQITTQCELAKTAVLGTCQVDGQMQNKTRTMKKNARQDKRQDKKRQHGHFNGSIWSVSFFNALFSILEIRRQSSPNTNPNPGRGPNSFFNTVVQGTVIGDHVVVGPASILYACILQVSVGFS
jgi:hypothetical protein